MSVDSRSAVLRTMRFFGARGGHAVRMIDRFLASDPGFNRLRSSLMSVITIGLILEAETQYVRLTHALQIRTQGVKLSPAALALAAESNHEILVVTMLLGAIVGLVGAFGIFDPTAKGQLISTLFIPVPMIAALTLGIALGSHRTLSLVLLAVVLSGGIYLRRFGPRGMLSGLVLFMGFFFGFFLHAIFSLGDMGWVCSAIGVGLVVALAVRFVLFYPRPAKALIRSQRSFGALSRKVASRTLSVLEHPHAGERQRRRLHRLLVQLDEAGLMIDAQLANSSAVVEGVSPQDFHRYLFDYELAITNVARLSELIADFVLPEEQFAQMRLAVESMATGDTEMAQGHATALRDTLPTPPLSSTEPDDNVTMLTHRFADAVSDAAASGSNWMGLDASQRSTEVYVPTTSLMGGWLPGSTQVSSVASNEPGQKSSETRRLAPYTRATIQMAVAVSAAIYFGDLLSPSRFFWAVIAVFITFMGANNTGEQVQKGVNRILGTIIGVLLGSLIASAIGHNADLSIAIILVSLFLSFYLMRVNSSFMAIGITVMVSQLYEQLVEFSNSLLLVRVEETAIGSAISIIVVLSVFPLGTRRVLLVAMRNNLQSLDVLVGHAIDRLVGRAGMDDSALRHDARSLDAAYQSLLATAQPLRRNIFGSPDEESGRMVRLAGGIHDFARVLVEDSDSEPLGSERLTDVDNASIVLSSSIHVLAESCTGPRTGTYSRSSAMFDEVERSLEREKNVQDRGQLALHDLKLIDSSLARLAELLGVAVTG